MAKRKRPVRSDCATADKAEQFTVKLALALHEQGLAAAQADTVAAALAKAVESLPTGSTIQQSLKGDLSHYTIILVDKLEELQPSIPQLDKPSSKKQKAALPASPAEQCFERLCHRTCSTDSQRVTRCHLLLAACVNLCPSGLVEGESGLSIAVDAIRSTLSELCTDGKDTAAHAKLLQPIVAKLCAVIMLQHKKAARHEAHAGQHTQELLQIGAEAVVLAAEIRSLAESSAVDRQIAFASYDIKTLAGGDYCSMLQLLLNDPNQYIASGDKAASTLWPVLYRAAEQLTSSYAGERGYLLRIAAAGEACDRLPMSQRSQILAPFDSLAAPASFIGWLQQQPRSQIVQQCLDFLQHSPVKLTQHLLYGSDARSLLALHIVTNQKEIDEAADHEPAPQAADNTLFYVDQARDTAFERGWEASDSEENADGQNGLDLEKLAVSPPGSSASSDDEFG